MKELKNRGRQRWRDYICLFVSFLFVLYFGFNHKDILEESQTLGTGIKVAMLGFVWAVGTIAIFIKLNFDKKVNRILNILYVLLAPFVIYINMELAIFTVRKTFRGMNVYLLIYNVGVVFAIELLLIIITNRVRLGTDICAVICVFFNVINHFIYEFRGTPVMALDLATISTAADVADQYEIKLNFYTLLALLVLFAFIMIGRVIKCEPVFNKVRYRFCGIAATAVLLVGGIGGVMFTGYLEAHGHYLSLFNPLGSYQRYGSLAGFTKSFEYVSFKKPENYSPKRAEEIASKYQSDTVDTSKKRPNVIVVINEAFSDLKALGDFQASEDYMPFIHSLMKDKNCVSGTSYSSIVGGQTANTEYEFLTGNSLAFLPTGSVTFQLWLKDAMPSLATQLESEGYMGNNAFHLCKATNYRRDRAYPLLGFEGFYNSWNATEEIERMRDLATDRATYKAIIADYEDHKKNSDDPYFAYTMTVQNHSPYISKGDPNFEQKIKTPKIKADDVANYLSLIKYTDEAFEDMVNYFKQVDEPTVILMTGDHQPRIRDSSMSAMTKDKWKNWNDEEMMKHRYAIPFVIWANYDIEKKMVEQTSMNYLQTIMLETIGSELTGFQKYQEDIEKEIPVLTGNGYIGADGKFYKLDDENSPYYSLIQDYSILVYNDLMDSENRVNDFFELQK